MRFNGNCNLVRCLDRPPPPRPLLATAADEEEMVDDEECPPANETAVLNRFLAMVCVGRFELVGTESPKTLELASASNRQMIVRVAMSDSTFSSSRQRASNGWRVMSTLPMERGG